MKTDPMRLLGWGVPILCMAVAIFVVVSQTSAYKAASAAQDQANRDVEQAAKDKKAAQSMRSETRFAAAPKTSDEEPQFINYLRTRATADGVSLDKWTSQSLEYGKDKGNDKQDPKVTALLKGISRISSYMILSGPYVGLRQLVGELEASNRLYTLSNITWSRNKDGDNVLAMTVGRYVVSSTQGIDEVKP